LKRHWQFGKVSQLFGRIWRVSGHQARSRTEEPVTQQEFADTILQEVCSSEYWAKKGEVRLSRSSMTSDADARIRFMDGALAHLAQYMFNAAEGCGQPRISLRVSVS
jgi:hypothetical protein